VISRSPVVSIHDEVIALFERVTEPLNRILDKLSTTEADGTRLPIDLSEEDISFTFSTVFTGDRGKFADTFRRQSKVHIQSVNFALDSFERAATVLISEINGFTFASSIREPSPDERIESARWGTQAILTLVQKKDAGDIILGTLVAKELEEFCELIKQSRLSKSLAPDLK